MKKELMCKPISVHLEGIGQVTIPGGTQIIQNESKPGSFFIRNLNWISNSLPHADSIKTILKNTSVEIPPDRLIHLNYVAFLYGDNSISMDVFFNGEEKFGRARISHKAKEYALWYELDEDDKPIKESSENILFLFTEANKIVFEHNIVMDGVSFVQKAIPFSWEYRERKICRKEKKVCRQVYETIKSQFKCRKPSKK